MFKDKISLGLFYSPSRDCINTAFVIEEFSFFCKYFFLQTLPNFFHTASIWLTLVLAIQRYIYVCHAPFARRFCTLPIVYRCVGYTLVVSALHQVPKMFDTDYHSVSTNRALDAKNKLNFRFVWISENREREVFFFGSIGPFVLSRPIQLSLIRRN